MVRPLKDRLIVFMHIYGFLRIRLQYFLTHSLRITTFKVFLMLIKPVPVFHSLA